MTDEEVVQQHKELIDALALIAASIQGYGTDDVFDRADELLDWIRG